MEWVMIDEFCFNTAVFSPCRTYRYTLWRWWDKADPSYCLFIGLNPSTADETHDDQTIRRCIGFAQTWGYGGLCMVNLFALRATNPGDMLAHPMPIGPDNDKWLDKTSKQAGEVVAAWGVKGSHLGRDDEVIENIGGMKCLGTTEGGFPRHPLYVRSNTELMPFTKQK